MMVICKLGFDNVPTADPQNVGGTARPSQFLARFTISCLTTCRRTSLHGRRTLWHFYGQDDVKLTRNLTVNLGLRYEYSAWFTPIRTVALRFFDRIDQIGRRISHRDSPLKRRPTLCKPL